MTVSLRLWSSKQATPQEGADAEKTEDSTDDTDNDSAGGCRADYDVLGCVERLMVLVFGVERRRCTAVWLLVVMGLGFGVCIAAMEIYRFLYHT